MALLDILLSGKMLGAFTVYSLAIVVVELLSARLHAVANNPVSEWMLEHIALPFGRAVALTLFVLTAYPLLFGLEHAPSLGALLNARDGRLSALLNLAFILTLLLPLLPRLGLRQGLVLPLQGIGLSTLLFHWLVIAAAPIEVHYWPGWGNALWIVALAFATPPLAGWLAGELGGWLNRRLERSGAERLVYEGVLLLMQAPSILIYTSGLGRQLS